MLNDPTRKLGREEKRREKNAKHFSVVPAAGIEPAANSLEGCCSIP